MRPRGGGEAGGRDSRFCRGGEVVARTEAYVELWGLALVLKRESLVAGE